MHPVVAHPLAPPHGLHRSSFFFFLQGSPAPVVVWNLKERQAVYVLSGLTDQVTALGFTPDDAFVVGTDIKGKMCVWNMKTGQCDITTVSKNPCSCRKFRWRRSRLDTHALHAARATLPTASGSSGVR